MYLDPVYELKLESVFYITRNNQIIDTIYFMLSLIHGTIELEEKDNNFL